MHLRQKDFDDYSGGESYVFSKTLELVRDANTHAPLRDIDTDLELKRPLPQIDLLWFPQKVFPVICSICATVWFPKCFSVGAFCVLVRDHRRCACKAAVAEVRDLLNKNLHDESENLHDESETW